MKILKVIGGIGAIVASAAGLVLAGKSEFGKNLFTGNDGADLGEPEETPTETKAEEMEEVPTMEEIVEEPANSSDTE